jgi:shikimate kinase
VNARRISVVGTSCSGKTTLARELAGRLGVAHVELDAIHWQAGWKKTQEDEFERRVREAVAAEGWVACGNYSAVRPWVWERADAIVWLDYSFLRVMSQWARRTTRRMVTRERCCGDNVESLVEHFRPGEGLFWWILRTWPRNRRRYPGLLAASGRPHVRLRSPRETHRWLEGLARSVTVAGTGVSPFPDATIER